MVPTSKPGKIDHSLPIVLHSKATSHSVDPLSVQPVPTAQAQYNHQPLATRQLHGEDKLLTQPHCWLDGSIVHLAQMNSNSAHIKSILTMEIIYQMGLHVSTYQHHKAASHISLMLDSIDKLLFTML